MKTNYKALLCAFLMCTLTSNANAEEGDILSENFNSGFAGLHGNSIVDNVEEPKGWTLMGCDLLNTTYGKSLKLAYSGSGYAYATTPAFKVSACNAILSLKAANTANSNQNDKRATVVIKISNNGEFSGGAKTFSKLIDNNNSANFIDIKVKLYNVGDNTRLTFTLQNTNYYIIDDVTVTRAENLSLSETASDISQTEKTADVTLGRTLQGGIWNTLCLPFDVDKAFTLPKALGEDQNIQLRTFSSYADGTINFEDKESVEAGTPFLIKIDNTVTNPTFPLVDVKNTSPQIVEYGGVSMVGTYGQTSISSDAIFLTSSGELMKPSGSTTLKGLRAYFTTTDGSRLTINFGDATAVKNVQAPAATTSDWFTLDGRRLASQPTKKGLYIRNGKKIIIK